MDAYGRTVRYLRISVTNDCTLRCIYCAPQDAVFPKKQLLSKTEIVAIAKTAVQLGIEKIRLTGGEPLLRDDILDIAAEISALEGLSELCLTTNGILLDRYAEALKQAGVNRLNISLDSLDPIRYHKLTGGGDLQSVLGGIAAAKKAEFSPMKINVVLLAGENEDEICDFIHFGKAYGVDIRFIEQMPIGVSAEKEHQHFLPADAVLAACPALVPVSHPQEDSLERLYQLPDSHHKIGLIAPLSRHFCGSCNRIRVTADGMLKPCLHSADEIALVGLSADARASVIRQAVLGKPKEHTMQRDHMSKSTRNMLEIGG